MRGSLLHELFAVALRELRAQKRRPTVEADSAWLLGHLDRLVERLRRRLQPLSETVFQSEVSELRRDALSFLRLEEQAAKQEPVGLEVSFGLRDMEGEPLDRPDPVELELPEGVLRLRGRIDRIDRLPDGTYEVADYKTGTRHPHKVGTVFAGGKQLQHALYGVVAETLLRRDEPQARVARSAYLFPSERATRAHIRIPAPPRGELLELLSELLGVLQSGAFLHTPDQEMCRFCDFKRVCGARSFEQARRKLDQASEDRLEPFRRAHARK